MQAISNIRACREAVLRMQQAGQSVGFVPTMGALHAGHLSLIQAAKSQCDAVVVSIFVNPTQFGPNEDLQNYPRPLTEDLRLCGAAGVALVFTPAAADMYPVGATTTVRVGTLGEHLCGPFRPGHFEGVSTVVSKLFHIAPANAAFFGEKDYQQLAIIRQMVADLNFPIEIVGCPTIREPDGLAMSSRNAYLSESERRQAASISRGLFAAVAMARTGVDAANLARVVRDAIVAAGPVVIEYVDVVDAETLALVQFLDRPARICAAVRIGATRLIDNVAVDPAPRAG